MLWRLVTIWGDDVPLRRDHFIFFRNTKRRVSASVGVHPPKHGFVNFQAFDFDLVVGSRERRMWHSSISLRGPYR